MGNRTASGAPSSTARDRFGDKAGRFPVFDHKSAMSALKLRGHDAHPERIIAKVSAWATRNKDQAVLDACAAARKAGK
jgi:hypothetical protein